MRGYITTFGVIAGTVDRLAVFVVEQCSPELYCRSDCENEEGCPHPFACARRWLMTQAETKTYPGYREK